jgi:hypothetical protein
MKKLIFLALALALVLGFQSSLLAAQPTPPPIGSDIGEVWLFDTSGLDQGGAVLTFFKDSDDGITEFGHFTAYGVGRDTGPLELRDGTYEVNIVKGTISGRCTVAFDSSEGPFEEVMDFTGKADKKRTKISLKFIGGPNAKGIKLPDDPTSLNNSSWLVTGSGQGGDRVALDVDIVKDGSYPSRVYQILGQGNLNDTDSLYLQGGFFLTTKSVAYGIYQVYADEGLTQLLEEGFFTGKINFSSNKFVFKLISTEGAKGTMKGEKQ